MLNNREASDQGRATGSIIDHLKLFSSVPQHTDIHAPNDNVW